MVNYDSVVRVYDKRMNLLAVFDKNADGLSPEEMRNLMIAPTVRRETNGESTLSFQMLVNSEKWQLIKDPENIYVLNGHHYTALNDNAYQFSGEGGVRVVNVTLVETWYLLDKKYVQAYNCGIYCYAKATFSGYTTDGAIFTINSSGCSNPSETISNALAWNQVKLWTPQDEDGYQLTYGILQSDEYKPTGWEDAPAGVFFTNFSVSGNTATVTIRARAKTQVQKNFEYSGSSYSIDTQPYPASIESVYINTTKKETVPSDDPDGLITSYTRYTTSNKTTSYSYSGGTITVNYTPTEDETINSVIIQYSYYDLGSISSGATCTFAYGAEVVDEHTFVILPKSKTKYKLTVNGVEYEDNQVRDSRGAIMPRGSGGYALWAALRDTGWSLGVCDVIAKGFDASIDYGCFNIESDMQDVLYNIQYIQELYGGILDFDSENKVVNYRAENSNDYESYNDGFNDWTGYEFREGKNMTDQPQITWDNEIITRAYLLGYGNLNVKKVNGGKTYVENFSYTNDLYEGYLEQSLIYDTRDDGGMNQLLYWGQKELAKKCRPRIKITASVTDVRTVEGYEHEVFDLNDVVRCYYKDSETGEETYEEKRITLWEYNAFAMWDCTVEIGDKTQNFVDVFKLIYNTAIDQAPKTNASGEISADEIVIDIPNWGDLDIGDWGVVPGGGGGGLGYGYGYGGMSAEEYLSLIVRKTTDNSDAIAGLILEANELYAQTQLFATYQKVTENMVSDTYAGLTLYADEQVAALELVVEGHYQETIKEIGTLETYTRAGFEAQADKNSAFTRQFSEVDTSIRNINGTLTSHTTSIASLNTYADSISATVSANARLETTHYNELTGEISKVSSAQATFEATVTRDYAKTSTLSSYATKDYVTGEISSSRSSIETWATNNFASASLRTTVTNLENRTNACISVSSTTTGSTVTLRAYNTGTKGTISVSSSNVVVGSINSVPTNIYGTSITIGSAGTLTLTGSLIIGSHGASWKTATISGTTINYLGY